MASGWVKTVTLRSAVEQHAAQKACGEYATSAS